METGLRAHLILTLICLIWVKPASMPSRENFAADAALLVAAVGLADHLAAALVDLHPAGLDAVRGVQRVSQVVDQM